MNWHLLGIQVTGAVHAPVYCEQRFLLPKCTIESVLDAHMGSSLVKSWSTQTSCCDKPAQHQERSASVRTKEGKPHEASDRKAMADILSSHWPCLHVKPPATALIPRAPSVQLSQDVRVTTFRFGCRLTFAMQCCNNSIKPVSCQLACHPVCGVVPLQKSNFGSHLW